MEWVITSDVHLGSVHCRHEAFHAFVTGLPEGTGLVLNGDTMDRNMPRLTDKAEAGYAMLCEQSRKRRIVWVAGNHDDTFDPPERAEIEFCEDFGIEKQLYITHGHAFDSVTPFHKPFLLLFRAVHAARIRLGAPAVHVAEHAKKFPALYRVLCRNVMRNAVHHAREKGFAAATCGHVHYPEDTMCDGIRYINTGSWTEPPHIVKVTPDGISLTALSTG